MIKGVNRRIVEITGMENDYFEKAVLYVRPDKSQTAQTRIELEACCAVGKIIPKDIAENCENKPKSRHSLNNLTIQLVSISLILFSLSLILYIAMG